jgi:uncharacterized repeat protein (TIGR01451 family)
MIVLHDHYIFSASPAFRLHFLSAARRWADGLWQAPFGPLSQQGPSGFVNLPVAPRTFTMPRPPASRGGKSRRLSSRKPSLGCERLEDRTVPALTIVPITWNVIGLDSNNVNAGPNTFPVGARVTNTGATAMTNVAAQLVWDTANANINLSPNNSLNLSVPSLAPGASTDFYYTVNITRTAAAYNTARGFHINATDTQGDSVNTPTPRQLYVEKLISQNRNGVRNISIAGPGIPGGSVTNPPSATVYIGSTYTITVSSFTATQGYDQLSQFVNFPNLVFQTLAVQQNYAVPSGYVNDMVYADASGWDNNPASGTYNQPTNANPIPGGKAGGDPITSVFTEKVLGAGSALFVTLIHDHSGSSFHYNADFGTGFNAVNITMKAPIDLGVTKTVDNATPNVGDVITFTVTVANSGDLDATNASLKDVLPPGATYVSDDGGGSYNSTTGIWTVGTVTALGGAKSLHIRARVTSPNVEVNTASVNAVDQVDGNPANDSASVTVTPRQADLQISKTDGLTNAIPGGTVTYTIVVTNAGPSGVADAAVHDVVPGLLFNVTYTASATGGATGFTASGSGDINDTLNLPAGSSVTYTFTGRVRSSATGNLVNTATVSSPTTYDPDLTNNSATDTDTLTPTADLQITKDDGQTSAVPGRTVTYRIVVTNAGPSDVAGAVVSDSPPVILTGVTYTASATGGATGFTASGNGAISDTVNMPAGAVITYVVTGTIDPSARGSLTNSARVAAPVTVTDPDPTNNSSTDTDPLTPSADLALTKVVDNAAPLVGQQVTFTLTLRNNGPSDATGVAVKDVLPAGLSYVSSTASQGSYDSSSGVWTVGPLAVGGVVTLKVTALVTAAGSITNLADVSAHDDPDPDSTNDHGSATVNARAVADLTLSKTVDDVTPVWNSQVTFTISLHNSGPNDASGVLVGDLLPAGLAYVSSSASRGTYTSATGVWSVGAVAVGETVTLQIVAKVTSTAAITNFTQVTAEDQFDPNPGDDQSSATVTPRLADLSLTKSVDKARPNVGDFVTFTLTLQNLGPTDAAGVAVTDVLPAGLTYVSCIPSQGNYDNTTGVWTVGGVLNGGSATLKILAHVTAAGVLKNIADVTASNLPDPDPTNNEGTATVTPLVADLSLTKTVNNAAPAVGQNVTFTLTLHNSGPDDATNVTVHDALPAGLAFVSSAGPGSYDSASGTWTIGTVTSGSSVQLTIVCTVSQAGPITNLAEVMTADQFDPDSTPGNGNPNEDDESSATVTGQIVTGQIRGRAFLDANANGVQETGDGGVPSVAVDLLDGGGNVIASTTTAPDGTYSFPVANPGVYAVRFARPTGDLFSPAGQGGDPTLDSDPNATTGITPPITVAAGQTVASIDAGLFPAATFGDFVWLDTNGNGMQDAGEPGVVGVFVRLYDAANNLLATATTDNTGHYSFAGLRPGTYTLAFDPTTLPANAVFVAPHAAGSAASNDSDADPVTGRTLPITVGVGQTNNDIDAGVEFLSSIAGHVYVDTNLNGVRDAGDLPIGSVKITLSGQDDLGNLVNVSTTTLADGTYSFAGLREGIYQLDEVQPVGYVDFQDSPGTPFGGSAAPVPGDTINNIHISTGGDGINYDFGEMLTADLSLTKTVDKARPIIGDIVTYTITVLNSGPSDATGVKVIDVLPAGVTYVNSNASAGSFDSNTSIWTIGGVASSATVSLQIRVIVTTAGGVTNTAEVGASDQVDPDSAPNNHNPNEDDQASAAIITSPLSSIAGQVYVDFDNNGSRMNGEPPIGGVTITLTGVNDLGANVSQTIATLADGTYQFVGLRPGTYTVTVGRGNSRES